MKQDTLTCPHCNKEIALNEAFMHGVEAEMRTKMEADMTRERQKLQEEMKKREESIRLEVKESFGEEVKNEMDFLKKKLADREDKIESFREMEMKLREEKDKLEEAKKDYEIEMRRKVEEEKQNLIEKTSLEFKLREAEKDKLIDSLKTSMEEMKRKADQGSQQMQGEILELDLENTLRNSFVNDQIEEVAKGRKGADLKQIVKTSRGNVCGVIIWEFKRTKAWQGDWTQKLKDDMRAEKANVPIIVTTTMPKELKTSLGFVDGVWVCTPAMVLPTAEILRSGLIEVAKERFVSEKRGEKSELLYNYMTSHEFIQKIEALAETYGEMREQIEKERAAFERIWKSREMQTRRLMLTTAGMVGELRGLLGQSLPSIKNIESFELPEDID
jgi:hypothetical protein